MPPRALSERSPVCITRFPSSGTLNSSTSSTSNNSINSVTSSNSVNSQSSSISSGSVGGMESTKTTEPSGPTKKKSSVSRNGSSKKEPKSSCLPKAASQPVSIMITGGAGKRGKSSAGARSRKPTKAVVFSQDNEVFPVVHLDDMSSAEIASIWYDPKEYADIKASYQATIFLMEKAEAAEAEAAKQSTAEDEDEDSEHTFRGLEYRTQQGAWARYENKRDAYNAVLDEQDDQWKNDLDDDEALRRVYLAHSSKCASAAHERALQDAAVAKRICLSFYQQRSKKHAHHSATSGSAVSTGSSAAVSKDNVRKLLKEQSFSRRNQVRDDIALASKSAQQQQQNQQNTQNQQKQPQSPSKKSHIKSVSPSNSSSHSHGPPERQPSFSTTSVAALRMSFQNGKSPSNQTISSSSSSTHSNSKSKTSTSPTSTSSNGNRAANSNSRPSIAV